MLPRILTIAAALAFYAGGARAEHEALIGPLAEMVESQVAEPWQASVEDGWFVLRNGSGDDEQLMITRPMGPPGPGGRTTSATVSIAPDGADENAAVGIVLTEPARRDFCVIEIIRSGAGFLLCFDGDQTVRDDWVEGAARLDGSDTVEIQEVEGTARFLLNGREIGQISDHPALGQEIGILAFDRGTFGVAGFAITPGEPPGEPSGGETSAGDDLAGIVGPLADLIVTKPAADGWSIYTEGGWFVMENAAARGSTVSYAAEAGPPGAGGRSAQVSVALTLPEGLSDTDVARSTVGLIVQNRDNDASCIGEVTGAGDATLTCFNNGNVKEVARLPGIAKLDGSDVIELRETPGQAQFLVNGQLLGDVTDSPARNGQIGIAAYSLGRFHVSGFSISDAGAPADGAEESDGKEPAGEEVPDVTGDGPLPWFGGDKVRVTSAYLGVTNGIFMHEFGHALIGELQIPSTGPEEDAVDIFSALRVAEPTNFPTGDPDIDAIAEGVATYAALQWYYSGKVVEQRGETGDVWQDEHTADLKRFRNSFCVMYGSNPRVFADIAQGVGMDERTLDLCEDEFAKQNRAWRTILAPYTRIGEWHPDGLQAADASGAPIEVVFEPSRRKVGNLVAERFGDGLRGFAEELAQTYVLPRPLRVIYRDCGEFNAWYSPGEASITMCYDLIEDLVAMIHDFETGSVSDGPAAINELVDLGIPPTPVLFPAPYNGPTPVSNPRAQVITTGDLAGLLKGGGVLLIDTRGAGETLPDALVASDAGQDGSVTDGFQDVFGGWLREQTRGNDQMALVFFGTGMNDRSAYNAALRAGSLGYARVYWYRGGIEAWAANGQPLAAPD